VSLRQCQAMLGNANKHTNPNHNRREDGTRDEQQQCLNDTSTPSMPTSSCLLRVGGSTTKGVREERWHQAPVPPPLWTRHRWTWVANSHAPHKNDHWHTHPPPMAYEPTAHRVGSCVQIKLMQNHMKDDNKTTWLPRTTHSRPPNHR